jgi:hypothetical protein
LVNNQRVRRIEVTREVEREFKEKYKCVEPQPPNIGGIKWIDSSDKLLLVAEVPPHSNCPQMGLIMGYVVSLPSGKIMERFDLANLNIVWGNQLGLRLKR